MVDQVLIGGFADDPFPTIGIAFGTTDNGTVRVTFAGDIRPMVALGEALVAGAEPIEVEVEEWQLLGRPREIPKDPEG